MGYDCDAMGDGPWGPLAADPRVRPWLEHLERGGTSIVLVRDRHRRTTYVSGSTRAILGIEPADFADPYRYLHADDQPSVFEASDLVRGTGAPDRRRVRFRCADGAFLPLEMLVTNRADDPAIDGLVCEFRPIGEPHVDDDTSRLEAILRSGTDLVVLRDREVEFRFVSPSVQHLLGWSPDQFLRHLRDIVHHDDLRSVAAEVGALEDEPDRSIRRRVRLKDSAGRWRHFDFIITNKLHDPTLRAVLSVGRDITDLVETELALRRSRLHLQAIFDASEDVLLLVDRSGVITFASAGVERLTQESADDMIGRTLFDFVHPDDRERTARAFADLVGRREQDHVLLRCIGAGGETWVEVYGRNAFDVPEVDAVILSVRRVEDQVQVLQRLEALLRHATGAVLVVDTTGEITFRGPGSGDYLGAEAPTLDAALQAVLEEPAARTVTQAHREVATAGPGAVRSVRTLLQRRTGAQTWVDMTFSHVADRAVRGVVLNVRDVDEQVRSTEAGQRLSLVLESSTDMVLLFDQAGQVLWANAAAAAFMEQLARRPELRLPQWVQEALTQDVRPALDDCGLWRGELAARSATGHEIPIETTVIAHAGPDGQPEFFSCIARDISERKAMESQLHAQARHDALTGLPNRTLLVERLEQRIRRHPDRPFAVAFLDLDQFKVINDSHGHGVGDQLLVTFADRLRRAVRPSDVVARFGGDEFVVLWDDITGVDDARHATERLVRRVRGPIDAGPLQLFVTVSCGVAVSDAGGEAFTLIRDADTAMYRAKELGRDRVELFDEGLRERTVSRLDVVQRLRAALDEDALEVWLQPVVDTASSAPVALEALARWQDPTLGLIGPDSFVRIAEDSGLIVPLGEVIIRRTCMALRGLDEFAPDLPVGLNISARQLSDSRLLPSITSALDEFGVSPHRLVCEVTESAVMQDTQLTSRILHELRDLGVRIVIDDFGTGYSSLAYLHRFPIDSLKIDREFIAGLSYDVEWDQSLVAGITSLGHSLGLHVVAEGVEQVEQADILAMLGCDALQGFLFSEAVPMQDLPAVLARLARSSIHGS